MKDNIEVVQQIYEAFGRGDIPAILAAMDPEVVWGVDSTAPVPWYGLRKGPEGVRSFFAELGRGMVFRSFAPHHFAAAGGTVFNLITYDATIQPGDTQVEITAAQVWQLRGGKVVSWRGYEDTSGVLAAQKGQARHEGTPGEAVRGRVQA